MDGEDLDEELGAYLSGSRAPNWEMSGVQIEWIEDDPQVGVLHIAAHDVTKTEVEEVLFEIPPEVESKRHPNEPDRTIFWGATRKGRWLFISCEDWDEVGIRHLKPITAFEPDEGRAYWEQQ